MIDGCVGCGLVRALRPVWTDQPNMNENAQPITLLVCALGGESGGVLTEWLVERRSPA